MILTRVGTVVQRLALPPHSEKVLENGCMEGWMCKSTRLISPVGDSTLWGQENELQHFLSGLTAGRLRVTLIVMILYNLG